MDEIWKDINGYEGYYQVSNFGRVRSVEREINPVNQNPHTRQGYILTSSPKTTLYCRISLSRDNKVKKVLIHRLVASAFIPNPENKTQVNHIDLNPSNNHISNLEWVTDLENKKHSMDINPSLKYKPFRSLKLNRSAILDIKTGNLTGYEYAKKYNCSQGLISMARNNRVIG